MKSLALAMLLLSSSCVQSTGGTVVSFTARASGDATVVSGGPLSFTTPAGFDVTLTRANLTVGAMYLNQQNPQNYTLEANCIQDGVYSGEVRGLVVVDALSPTPVDFPVAGNGTDALTRAAELWLTGGDLTAEHDRTVLLDVAGTAQRGVEVFPFEGKVTISSNRTAPPRNPALPGSNPLCRQRIVSPIAFDARLSQGATVTLHVDPRAWFSSVDFSELTKTSDSPLQYEFIDDASSTAQPDRALYNGLRSAEGPYRLEVTP